MTPPAQELAQLARQLQEPTATPVFSGELNIDWTKDSPLMALRKINAILEPLGYIAEIRSTRPERLPLNR
jgi:hypothetical protein